MAATSPSSPISEFEQALKEFIDSKKTAKEYVNLLMSFEKARDKKVTVTNIIRVIEKTTKTEMPDEF